MPSAGELSVYRYFTELAHAEDFVRGKIRFSTLERCRTIEDTARRDAFDGQAAYTQSGMEIPQKAAHHFPDPRGRRMLIERSTVAVIFDAGVLCLTAVLSKRFAEKFGPHIVQVNDKRALVEAVREARSDFGQVAGADARWVTYRREPELGDYPDEEIPLCKHLLFKEEEEWRILLQMRPPVGRHVSHLDLEMRPLQDLARIVAAPT